MIPHIRNHVPLIDLLHIQDRFDRLKIVTVSERIAEERDGIFD